MVFTAMLSIKVWGVAAAAVCGFVFGGLYFGALVPIQYARALGRENLAPSKPTPLVIFGPFVCNVVMILTTATVMRLSSVASLWDALSFGVLVGVGYLTSMCMTIAINPNFPRPFQYTLVNAPYFLGSSLMTSTILFLLR